MAPSCDGFRLHQVACARYFYLILIMGAGIQTVCVHAACECVHVIWCVLAYVDAC